MIFYIYLLPIVFLLYAAPNCAKRTEFDLGGKIIGGTPTTIEEYPYQASLLYFSCHICGASIISPTWIVTAAHCTDSTIRLFLSIRVGSSQRDSGGTVYSVKLIKQHPQFNLSNRDYDISLLQLQRKLKFSAQVQPINVPYENQVVEPGTETTVTGWGSLREHGAASLVLRTVTILVVSLESCRLAYPDELISERMLCAGVEGGGKDTCEGDSGGPLVANGELQGIVSWGYGCGRRDYPGVYTSVAALRSYIKNITDV